VGRFRRLRDRVEVLEDRVYEIERKIEAHQKRIYRLEQQMATVDDWADTLSSWYESKIGPGLFGDIQLFKSLPVKVGKKWFVSGTYGSDDQRVVNLTDHQVLVSYSATPTAFHGLHMTSVEDLGILFTLNGGDLNLNKLEEDGTITKLADVATLGAVTLTVAVEAVGHDDVYYAYCDGTNLYFRKYVISTDTDSAIGNTTASSLRGMGVRPGDDRIYFGMSSGATYYRKYMTISGGATTQVEDHGTTIVKVGYKGMYVEHPAVGDYILSLYDDSKDWTITDTFAGITGSDHVVILDDSSYPIKAAVVDESGVVYMADLETGGTVTDTGVFFSTGPSNIGGTTMGPLRPGGQHSYNLQRWQNEWQVCSIIASMLYARAFSNNDAVEVI
jgi:hypothetical protein